MRRKLLFGVLAVVLVLTATAYLLPRHVTVQYTAQLLAPPEVVFPLLSTPAEWPKWSPWTARDPEMQLSFSGPPTGVGAAWSWRSASEGTGTMTFTLSVPSVKAEYSYTTDGLETPATGDFLIAPNAEGSIVAWTMRSDMGNSPIGRWKGVLWQREVRREFADGLTRLSNLAQILPPPPPILGIEAPITPP
jgi:uncharacterized protein YndB with AHSA1/START domain